MPGPGQAAADWAQKNIVRPRPAAIAADRLTVTRSGCLCYRTCVTSYSTDPPHPAADATSDTTPSSVASTPNP